MAQSSNDRELVERLQRRFSLWTRIRHNWNCQYDAEGRLIYIGLDELGLSHVPPEVWQLTNLQRLDLSRNQLSGVPPELGQLTNLQRLDLVFNSLTMPPPEIVDRGVSAILDYLRGLQVANVKRYEAKLVLVGEARMGKSSLLRALRGLPFEPSLSPTHGIDVATLYVPHPTILGEKITLNMWDFGGQQIYQTSHQFFLTRRSIYLLVWDAAANAEASRLPFWLDTITTLAPDARILLVATHIDQWLPTLHVESYQQNYPQIAGACEVSCKDGEGLDVLRDKIAEVAALNPFVGMAWPGSWIKVEKNLQARPEYRIDIPTFLDICRQYRVEEMVALETLGPYLHDLGKVLYYHDDPFLRTIMVLRPNWITKVIGLVLQDRAVRRAEFWMYATYHVSGRRMRRTAHMIPRSIRSSCA